MSELTWYDMIGLSELPVGKWPENVTIAAKMAATSLEHSIFTWKKPYIFRLEIDGK
jgi:hypothetical protein